MAVEAGVSPYPFAALLASALIGIYAFLFGDFGETEVKILLTTLSISYFSVTSLACAAAFEKKKGWVLLDSSRVSKDGGKGLINGDPAHSRHRSTPE